LRAERTLSNESSHALPFAGTAEQRALFFPDEYIEGQSEEIVLFDDREYLDTRAFSDSVARHNMVYNESISRSEDSRLKPD
jgi:hypothetical protein